VSKPVKPKENEGERPDDADKTRRRPYPVNDPGIADPDRHPGSDPDYLPGSNPGRKSQL
jgi:hypothetical protein